MNHKVGKSTQRPAASLGLRHVALQVSDLKACEHFYTELLGMRVEWRPDTDNVYLSGGQDNLALHRVDRTFGAEAQRVDHFGFLLAAPEHVDDWHRYLSDHGVRILTAPRTHRDGARSFYCEDPEGNRVQLIYHPPLAKQGVA